MKSQTADTLKKDKANIRKWYETILQNFFKQNRKGNDKLNE